MEIICIFPKCVPRIPDFVVFPFTRTRQFENWWTSSGWSDVIPLDSLPEKILICEEHFEPELINRRHRVPKLALGALPTRNVECVFKRHGPLKPTAPDLVYCRLCGQKQTCKLDDDRDLLSDLDEIFHYQLHLSDFTTLPTGVCGHCKNLGKTMQTFWKKCSDAQESLKTIFNNEKTRLAYEPPKDASIAPRDKEQESSSVNATQKESIFVHREHFPAECEEIVIDTTKSEVIEEQHFASEYEFESYGEEPPASSTADECDEEIELRESEKQLLSENYAIDYGDDFSSQELPANFSSSDKEEHNDAGKRVEEPTHICEICGNSYKTLNRLKAHLNLHSDARNHQCTVCGHKFKTRRGLTEHVESKHERKSFPCKICGVQYSWKKGLERHMSTTHKGKPMKHVCKICDKAFPVPHKLKQHMIFNYMLTQHKIRVHEIEIEGVKLYKSKKLGD
uniref:Uncharacterized protein n=1 Tax=Anopheles stephensi TaxID=30069 RepID=A0A182YKJ3_ANOST